MTIKITKMDPSAKYYVKKPIAIRAIQINEPFEVTTMEGTLTGKIGDYLMEGIHGELYPCDRTIFEESYEESNQKV